MNSPKDLIESQFPSYFLEQYPQFIKFIEEYYNFLESSLLVFTDKKGCKVGDVLYGSLSKAKATVTLIADNKVYFEYSTENNNFYKNEIVLNGKSGEIYLVKNLYKNIYSFINDIEENSAYDTVQTIFKKYFKRNVSLDQSIFYRVDPNILTKKILDYYKNKGNDNSFRWFFKIFFDDDIDLYYPKVDILRLSDTNHIERRWMQIKYEPSITKFEKSRIIGEKSKATATVRQVHVKNRNNEIKAFLDLIYVNGEFQENENIIGFDIVSGFEKIRAKVLPSITHLKVTDGGIGHKLFDEFNYHDGIGVVTGLKDYSITNIKIKDPGHFYSVGDPVIFENDYTGATQFANAYVESIEPNYALSDYVNFLNNTLKYTPVQPYETSDLLDYFQSQTFANTDLLGSFEEPYNHIGSIKSIRIEKSGLDYRFAPNSKIINNNFQAQNLYLYELYIDDLDANTYFLIKDSIVILNDEPAVYAGSKIVSDDDVYFEGIDILAEDPYVETFYAPKILKDDLVGAKLQILRTSTAPDILDILTKNYNEDNLLTIEILNFNNFRPLGETASIESFIGPGVSTIQITDPGLMTKEDTEVCFIKGPLDREYDANNIIHPLDTTIEYETGVVFDSIGEFKENNSNLSSEKHIQDNYYYQDFSYVITSKIPTQLIEPLLLDELHPAGFIAFIRNRIEDEVSSHIKAEEFPRIEILAEGADVASTFEAKPYIVQMNEQYSNMNRDISYSHDTFDGVENDITFDDEQFLRYDSDQYKSKDYLYTFVEVNDTAYLETQAQSEVELEDTELIDVFEGFRMFVEDVIIRPESKKLQEFQEVTDGPFFDDTEVFFDSFTGLGKPTFDSYGVGTPTGYGTTSEYMRLERKELFNYGTYTAVESFLKIISVEDRANWKTNLINSFGGKIGDRVKHQINNHKAIVEDIIHIATTRNVGGKIVVRDWLPLNLEATFRFDNEFIYMDANTEFNEFLNYSGEIYNYTPNPIWYFDNSDDSTEDPYLGNDNVDDFSNTNILKPLFIDIIGDYSFCITPHHVHNSFNFSNEPATSYIPMVSGNSLGEKGAYLPETEILTRDKGFIFIKDVTSDDHLAFVHDNGKITWRKPDGLLKRNYSGMMYHFSDFNRISVTVTPDQDLVTYDDRLRPHITKAQKIRSKNINLPQSIHKSFGLVDLDLIGGVHDAVVDFIPIDERIHRTDTYYEGEVYCVIFNEYREYIPMDIDVSNVDIDLLQINSQIDNTTTYPKFQPAYFKFINHDMYENHIKIDIQKRDFTLNIETPDPIVFDFNTAKEPNTYISFVREDQLINDAKIRNFHGPSFDDIRPYSFDSTDGDYTFDDTGERYVVHPAQIYFGSNHVTTKIPDPVEQVLNYTEEINYDYFTLVDGHLPRYSNGDEIGAEITKYEELKYETEEIKYQIHETLTTEQEYKLYDRQFGIDITFDIQNADPPECISGHFDYIGDGDQDIYKFSSNNVTAEIPDILTFDELTDPCNYDSIPEGRRALFNTFDTVERSFDQTQDIIYDFGQKVDTHLIKSNSEDRDLVASKQNLAGISYKNNKTEVLIRGGDFHQPLVVTIKNYRPDPKKKFFDSLNYFFDKNYAWSFFAPWEHYGFDSEDTRGDSWIAPYDDVFRNISVTLVIHQHTDAYGPFGKNGCFDSTARLAGFDKEGPATFDSGGTKEVFFKYEDIDGIEQWRSKRIPLKCPPKPFVKNQPKIINAAFGDVSITGGNNEPIQTLQLINFTDENGIKGYGIEQVLINDNSIEICDLPYIYYDDVIKDFTFKVMYPYFQDLGCDPDTTPGTKAIPDYTLSNINLEYLTSTIYQDTIQTFDDSYVDSTMLVGDIHNWIILENYILACDPIRYDDVIYPYASKLISPYINEKCPSKQTLFSREAQSELHIINANTVSYMVDYRDAIVPTEDKFQYEITILANTANDVIWEHEIHSHIRSRNCAIGLNEFIHNHSFKEITDCHLKEPLSYWIEDSIYTAFAIPEFSIINDIVAHHPNYELGLIYPGATTVNYMAFEQTAFANTSNNGNLTTALLEHEIHTHIRGKNCAIGLNDFIYTHSFKEIDECYLKEPLSYWNGDAIYTAFAIPEFTITNDIVSQYPNTNYELGIIYPIVNEEQITTKPSNFDVRSSNTEHYITEVNQTFTVAANVLDKNIAFWEGEEISKKQYTRLDNSILQKALLPYVDDRIPTVFIDGAISILQSQSNTGFETSVDSAFYFTPIENFVDSTIRVDDDDNDSHIVSQINVLDRYKTISKERTFAHRLNEPIDFDDQIMFFEIVDTDRDRIPSVTAKPFSNIINTANTDVLYTPTFSTYTYDAELFIDATTSTEGIEAPSITNHIHLSDRNTIIPINRAFVSRLKEYIDLDGIMMDFKLVDYDGNYIPSIKAFSFSIVNSDANTSSDLNASIEQIHSIPDLFIDGTITFDYFPEIERSKHLIADWNFIEVGEPIASYLKHGLTNYTDRILRANRLDTTYGTKATSVVDVSTFSNANTVNTISDKADLVVEFSNMHIDSTMSMPVHEENSIFSSKILDEYSVIPLSEKFDKTWISKTIEDADFKNKIYFGKNLLPVVTTDQTFPMQTMASFSDAYSHSSSSTEFIYNFPELFVDATFTNEDSSEIQYDLLIPDRNKYLNLNTVIDSFYLSERINEFYLDKLLTYYDEFGLPSVTARAFSELEITNTVNSSFDTSLNFIYQLEEQQLDATIINTETFKQTSTIYDIPDRNKFINLNKSISGYAAEKIEEDSEYLKKILTYYDDFAIPSVTTEKKSTSHMQSTNNQFVDFSTQQEFIFRLPDALLADATFDTEEEHQIKNISSAVSSAFYFDLSQTIKRKTINKNIVSLTHEITEELTDKILVDDLNDMNKGMYISSDYEVERLVEKSGYGHYKRNGEYIDKTFEDMLASDFILNFDENNSELTSVSYAENEIENNEIIYSNAQSFRLENLITSRDLVQQLDVNRGKKIIENLAVHFGGSTYSESYLYDDLKTSNVILDVANTQYLLDIDDATYIDKTTQSLPIPSANLEYQVNRNFEISIFEDIEFIANNISANHNNNYFAIGTTPYSDINRESNILFGEADGVIYELDDEVYTSFAQYKTDFLSGTKQKAKITLKPTLSILQTNGASTGVVSGSNSDDCNLGYPTISANTYTLYYWSHESSASLNSIGGTIEIYELNNLEECLNYSINKTSYIDNIRSEKEFISA